MKKVVRNAAFEAFVNAPDSVPLGERLKDVRSRPLTPGGRVRMTLFERVGDGRPHPRMRFSFVHVDDPQPPSLRFAPEPAPSGASGLRNAIIGALREHADVLATRDLPEDRAPAASPRYWRSSIRVQRRAALFAGIRRAVEGWIGDGTIPPEERAGCYRAVAELEDEASAGIMLFDNADTGTYHSYRNDAPFVHYLEAILASLPVEGSESMAVLYSGTRESVRRQRDQAQAHLDYLMRHKYAHEVIEETNIERTLGGLLIDRHSRRIVSEQPHAGDLVPRYELLRIAPGADHPHAGAWVYRDGQGQLRRQDHTPVEVEEDLVRSAPCDEERLTFRRAPSDPGLREGIRFDWDGNGWVQPGKIDWVSWAGHCDVKAVLEQLGVTLTGEPRPQVTEYRSDTGETRHYPRDLLLEMVVSVLELGSVYSLLDGTGRLQRGVHHFGGSRNDSRPDRLQFTGPGAGRSFRWPLRGRQDVFRVTSLEFADGDRPDMGTVFFRHRPDLEAVSFDKNPRYLKTVEGDYNLIDVSTAKIRARIKVDVIDPVTGYPQQHMENTIIDLRPGARSDGRFFLGTHVEDPTERRMYRIYYEARNNRVVAELETYARRDGKWTAQRVPEQDVVMPMQAPLRCTLSREMKRDNPAQFQALLQLALQKARNICADTDKENAVWNGVVTSLDVAKLGQNHEARTERWRVDITARFGEASLDYLLRRSEHGQPEAYCPATPDGDEGHWPDFLWHDIPDVGSKGLENDDWIVNEKMVERNLITIRVDESVPSGFYVFDDHIKNVFELIYAGLAGYTHTVVHNNKRYGLRSEPAWKAAVDELERRRSALSFEP